MRLRLIHLLALLLLLAGCSGRYPNPTRIAVDRRELPPIREDKALVIFMFPPCARYSGISVNEEEKMLCRAGRLKRIRVVEEGARLITDFGIGEYGASYEEPGRHFYGAYHHADHCTWDRTDCVAVLKANLEPGKVYIVTFRWNQITKSGGVRGMGLNYGRLEITPVTAGREHLFLARLKEIDRVERIPGFREQGGFGELRSFYVSQRAIERVAQDRKDGVAIPHLGGRVTAEELTKEEEEEQRKKMQQLRPRDVDEREPAPKDPAPEPTKEPAAPPGNEQPAQPASAPQPKEQAAEP